MREDIKHIVNALKCVCSSNQVAAESLTELEKILVELENIGNSFDVANFLSIPGNSAEVYYYGVGEAGNPSNNTKNIKTIYYKTGVTTVFTQTLTYNSADNIVSITTS